MTLFDLDAEGSVLSKNLQFVFGFILVDGGVLLGSCLRGCCPSEVCLLTLNALSCLSTTTYA